MLVVIAANFCRLLFSLLMPHLCDTASVFCVCSLLLRTNKARPLPVFLTCQAASSDALKVPDRCVFITACQLNGLMSSCWEVDESRPQQLGGIDFTLTFCLNPTVAYWLRVKRVLSIIFKCVAKPLAKRADVHVAQLHQGGWKSVVFGWRWWWSFVGRSELMSWLQTGEGGGEVAWYTEKRTIATENQEAHKKEKRHCGERSLKQIALHF